MGSRMTHQLDELDLKIIYQLQKDGRVSITDLAKSVESSRPTVTNRLDRLMAEELVVIKAGVNLSKLNYKIADVGLEVISDETRGEIEKYFKECPRVLDVFRTPEKANIHLRVWGEDDNTIKSTIESFRDIPKVDIVYTHYLGTPIHGSIIIDVETKSGEQTPCGKICIKCHRYTNQWCLGCPLTTDYKGVSLE
jgi:Lrp/AsnC family leucine-responsive transcriptional regulator